jgi:steroid 5-alpha reductase family enzyme
MTAWSPFWLALGAVLAMMTLVWLFSLILRDASIIDAFWSLRLSLHILWRNRGRGEDYRHREMRERNPGTFPFRSLVTVFWLQAVGS